MATFNGELLAETEFDTVQPGGTPDPWFGGNSINFFAKDATVPTITNVSPAAASTILRTDTVSFRVTDNLDALSRVIVLAIYSTGRTETVHDGSTFQPGYTASTRTGITNGYDFVVSHSDAGWRTAGLTIKIIAFDVDGNTASPTDYAYTVSNPPTGPTVDTFSPADGATIFRGDTAAFHVIDDGGTPSSVVVSVTFADGTTEVVHNGSAFVGAYAAGSTRGAISRGYAYVIARSGLGWRSATLVFTIVAVDADGNAASDSTYNLAVSDPAAAPVIGNYDPTNGSQIGQTDAISVDVADESGVAPTVLIYVIRDGQITEVVYQGASFAFDYTGGSTTPITNGNTYSFARNVAWECATIDVVVKAIDADGNVVSDTSYSLTVDPAPAAPTIDNIDPVTASTITASDNFTFSIVDYLGNACPDVLVYIYYPDTEAVEFVYNSTSGWSPLFDDGSSTDGIDFTVTHDAPGWANEAFDVYVEARDSLGGTAQTSFSYEVSNPQVPDPPDTTAPVISNLQPAEGTAISRTDPIQLDVTDDSGTFRRVMVTVRYADGTYEVAHDGDGFAAKYSSLSSQTNVTNGYRYILRRLGGWQSAPTVKIFPIDVAGNEGA